MTAVINIRTDKDLKIACEKLFKELGLNLSTAINTFLRASIRNNGLPFELIDTQANFNKKTISSIKEGKKKIKTKKVKGYKSIKSLRKALGV